MLEEHFLFIRWVAIIFLVNYLREKIPDRKSDEFIQKISDQSIAEWVVQLMTFYAYLHLTIRSFP